MTPEHTLPSLGNRVDAMSEAEFLFFRALINKTSGIDLAKTKKSLLITRLTRRLQDLSCPSFSSYIRVLQQDPAEVAVMINHITTNVTRFYREAAQFAILRASALPEIMAAKKRQKTKKLRIWSAGCASGEEVYTILLEVCDFFGGTIPAEIDCLILGSDIDTSVLRSASKGEYPASALKGVAPDKIARFFDPVGAHRLRIKAQYKPYVRFKVLNLAHEHLAFRNPIDIIFCRNVVIYFNESTKIGIYQAFHRVLNDPGYFFSGHSENLFAHKTLFQFVEQSVYKKVA